MKTINIRKEELDRLADTCCRVFEVNIDDFYNKSRKRNAVDSRRTYFHILKTFFNINELELSTKVPFSLDRTTIMYAVDTADDFIECDADFRDRYNKIYKKFTGDNYLRLERLKRRNIKQKNR